jgi:2-isopropylmalate synthase
MGVAAAHLGLQAGADRIEGCLFGNGERTGNVDTLTVALNLFVNGVDPELEINDIHHVRRVAQYCTNLEISARHPYAGDLVFTAFSGSHQDAIKKGIEVRTKRAEEAGVELNDFTWAVPYIPIDPHDIGTSYESVIRVNSQSGKGGVAYVLRNKHNLNLPKRLQIEFSAVVQKYADSTGKELLDAVIYHLFCDEYLPVEEVGHELDFQNLQRWGRIKVISIADTSNAEGADTVLRVKVVDNGQELELVGVGNGPIDAFISAISELVDDIGTVQVLDYTQHALTSGQDAQAAAYVECRIGNQDLWGVGIDPSTTKASFKAIVSAVNRAHRNLS